MKMKKSLAVLGVWLGLSLASGPAAYAADGPAATGVIEGRVLNTRNGEYLENARLTIEGTSLETFTDSGGQFRLGPVRAGVAKVRVFFTGLDPLADTVAVTAGETVQRDFSLGGPPRGPGAERDSGVMKLSEFVVGETREMDAAALAINEQRFASNLKNVVSTEEFGNVAEGNVAEFLKFLPGVSINYVGGNAREISINGTPSANVPVTVDGFDLATASGDNNASRSIQVDMVSINNLSRIEVSYSPTPESQGGALAGSVNMVPRSSFERSKPVFNASAYIMMRDNARDFHKVAGPRQKPTRNVHPGFDFSYVAPVNKRFGYSLSAGYSRQYSAQDLTQNTWRGTSAATDGNAFPHTLPDRPYLTSYGVQDEPKETSRRSLGATTDWKFSRYDRLSFGLQYSSFDVLFMNNRTNFNVGRVLPGDFTPTATRGAPGAGNIQMTHLERNRYNRTYMPTMVWRHDGPTWKSETGFGFSQQSDYNRDDERGFFRSSTVQRTGVTVSFDDIFYLRPRVITVTDGATGAPVDPFALGSYALAGTSFATRKVAEVRRTAYSSLRRDFYGPVPLTLKAGVDVRQGIRDMRAFLPAFTYVGRDGRSSTTPAAGDDGALPFLDEQFSQRVSPYGFPAIQTVSNNKLWRAYRDNPALFLGNANNDYRGQVNNSKRSEEIVSSVYLRGDAAFLDRRLKLIGGVRAEQTNIDAEGPLTDPTRNFQRRPDGTFILGANGRPLPIAADALGISQRTFIDRGAHTQKEYLRFFPSLNASFSLRENLIARAAHYYSVGRPNFDQYAGGLTLPDTELPASPANRIIVNNAGIKAWSARSTNVRLEYYFQGVGQISVSAFRRDFENFFGGTVFNPTPEFLALYSLDPAIYSGYDVSTQQNLPGSVRLTGFDVSYKQALTFLPHWARGVQVFANGSSQRATGEASENFAGYVPRSASWGVSLTRERYNARVNWNYRGRQRRGVVAAGPSIEPGTYNWGSKRLYIDVLGEYNFQKRFAVFANLRNVGDATEDAEIYGPSTPKHARFRQRLDYGALWTFGVKGTF